MDGGVPATADEQHVARHGVGGTVGTGDQCVGDAGVASGAGYDAAGAHLDTALAAQAEPVFRCLGAGIDDARDADPSVVQIDGCLVRAVVGGEHHGLGSYRHAVAMQERTCTVRQHDSGSVVVGENDGPLVGTGGHQDVTRANTPDSLTAQRCRSFQAQVIGAALEGEHEAVVVGTERGGAAQQRHVGERRQLGHRVGNPVQGRPSVDDVVGAEQGAAELALIVDDDHASATAGGDHSGRQTGRAGSDDQQVGVGVHGVVLGGVGDLGETPLSGDAPSDQAVVQLDRRGEQHRLGERLLDLYESAGVLGPRCGESSRPTELDAGGDLMNTVGEQRRRQRVAGMSLQGRAAEREFEGVRAVDAAAGCGAECGHGFTGFGSSRR
ncbi:unannotated protein [freshwater metagenome]|uniref:Unannotated protein n=1 Tax=freshwater metagenome TaxID=449393 RepID=A0A6J7F4D2_9ZZZZ